jgi:flagellar motor switch protein FliG
VAEAANREKTGIFINGKSQVVEMLKSMNATDKNKLLQNLKIRNPALAKELAELCFGFESIWDLSDEHLRTVFMQVKPVLIGLALYMSNGKNQRRVLSLLNREHAVKSYEVMTQDLSSHRKECLKAQEKILEIIFDLARRKIIQF